MVEKLKEMSQNMDKEEGSRKSETQQKGSQKEAQKEAQKQESQKPRKNMAESDTHLKQAPSPPLEDKPAKKAKQKSPPLHRATGSVDAADLAVTREYLELFLCMC